MRVDLSIPHRSETAILQCRSQPRGKWRGGLGVDGDDGEGAALRNPQRAQHIEHAGRIGGVIGEQRPDEPALHLGIGMRQQDLGFAVGLDGRIGVQVDEFPQPGCEIVQSRIARTVRTCGEFLPDEPAAQTVGVQEARNRYALLGLEPARVPCGPQPQRSGAGECADDRGEVVQTGPMQLLFGQQPGLRIGGVGGGDTGDQFVGHRLDDGLERSGQRCCGPCRRYGCGRAHGSSVAPGRVIQTTVDLCTRTIVSRECATHTHFLRS